MIDNSMDFLHTLSFSVQLTTLSLPHGLPSWVVGLSSLLHPFDCDVAGNADLVGYLARVRVVPTPIKKSRGLKQMRWYAGTVDSLLFDPGRWKWGKEGELATYTTKIGRTLIHPRKLLKRPKHEKWHGVFPVSIQAAERSRIFMVSLSPCHSSERMAATDVPCYQ